MLYCAVDSLFFRVVVFDCAIHPLPPTEGIAVYTHQAPTVRAVVFYRFPTQIRGYTIIVQTEVRNVLYVLFL